MDLIKAIIIGIVQSITEWLPVSSSAHLAITSRLLQTEANIGFFVLLHLATLLSLVIYFRKKIITYFFEGKSGKNIHITKKGMYIIYATVPIIIFGYLLHDIIEKAFTDFFWIGIFLIINAAVLFSTRYMKGKKHMTLLNSLFVGFMQVFALLPGISRSGTTISSGMLAGVNKEDAMMFSLMLAIPAMLGAFLYELIKTQFMIDAGIVAGFITAVIVGYLALGILVRKVRKGKFHGFWIYCFILGVIMLFN